jgi:hypothetical protein
MLRSAKALQLAGFGARQGVQERDLARVLVGRQRVFHMVLKRFDLLGVGVLPGLSTT